MMRCKSHYSRLGCRGILLKRLHECCHVAASLRWQARKSHSSLSSPLRNLSLLTLSVYIHPLTSPLWVSLFRVSDSLSIVPEREKQLHTPYSTTYDTARCIRFESTDPNPIITAIRSGHSWIYPRFIQPKIRNCLNILVKNISFWSEKHDLFYCSFYSILLESWK